MAYKCSAGREVFLTFLLVGILSVILVPLFVQRTQCGPGTKCPSSLRQLHMLGTLYASSHEGRWPDATGSALWRSFAEMNPPLIERDDFDILACPAKGNGEPNRCDYLGPRRPVSQLKPGDPMGGDRPGNHGPGLPGSILLKDGSVVEAQADDPRWNDLRE
jgi:hypothetical protein